MRLNRFWSSVWSVLVYLVSVGMLAMILTSVATLFGILKFDVQLSTAIAASAVVAGSVFYLDWRWNWKLEHIGMGRSGAAVGRGALGLLLGAVAGLLAYAAGGLLTGTGLPPLTMPDWHSLNLVKLLLVIPPLIAAEMVFRGAAISRYQADLSPREVLLVGTLTPLAWLVLEGLIQYILPVEGLSPVIVDPWTMAQSIFLSLLFLRTDSVWLSTGLRVGMYVVLELLAVTGTGALAVWGAAAAILLALELINQQRMPRRVQPGGGGQRGSTRGRTVRGPWGPH